MNEQLIFNFTTKLQGIEIPKTLNNPFGSNIPKIAKIATTEFQEFITTESKKWSHDFLTTKGKMFGILVVQKADNTLGYIGTFSGNLPKNASIGKFIPSVFDDSTDDYFINKGMTTLTEMGHEIKATKEPAKVIELTENRKLKSLEIQQQLFENYRFSNNLGKKLNVIEIFDQSSHGKPPSAAGDCAAPKLLQHAFDHHLKPIAVAEFWWGNPSKSKERAHQNFYPACKDKCRPILEYMLSDTELFNRANHN